jgi:hypothetical protein
MNDLFASDSDTNGSEPLDEGGTWLLDLVSAVDHLRRGYRPGFSVWDALAEAIDWARAAPEAESAAFEVSAVQVVSMEGHELLQRAVRIWVLVMADRYNNGHHWPQPAARREFPPARVVTPR